MVTCQSPSRAQAQAFRASDINKFADVATVLPSPTGDQDAIIVRPARNEFHNYTIDEFYRLTILLYEARSARLRQVQPPHDLVSETAFIDTMWSPSGRYLVAIALGSSSRELVEIATDSGRARVVLPDVRTYVWLDDHRLLAATTTDPNAEMAGSNSHLSSVHRETLRQLMASGRGTSAVTFDADPVPYHESISRRDKVVLIDFRTGEQRTVWIGEATDFVRAPDSKHVIIGFEREIIRPREGESIWTRGRIGLLLFDCGSGQIAELPELKDVLVSSLVWAPDGKRLAVVGTRDAASTFPRQIFVANTQGRISEVGSGSLPPEAGAWKGCCALHFSGTHLIVKSNGGRELPKKTWMASVTDDALGQRLLLNESTSTPPVPSAEPEADVSGADLAIRIGGKELRLKAPFPLHAASVVDRILDSTHDLLMVQGNSDTKSALITVNLSSGELQSEEPWEGRIQVFGSNRSPGNPVRPLVVVQHTPHGVVHVQEFTPITRTRKEIISFNQFAANLSISKEGEEVSFLTSRGRAVSWSVRYPASQSHQKYPLVIVSGNVIDPYSRDYLNMEPLVTAGFVVVFADLDGSFADDGAWGGVDEVQRGIDKLRARVNVDTTRVGVMGHSTDAMWVYELMEHSRLFRCGAALSGFGNYISMLNQIAPTQAFLEGGQFEYGDNFRRETEAFHGQTTHQALSEYIAHSPFFQVANIHDPLLIIQGDLDYLTVDNGEQMFMSLLRLGRETRFIKYVGEGHTFDSPKNIEHMWSEIIRWFEHYLKDSSPSETNDHKP